MRTLYTKFVVIYVSVVVIAFLLITFGMNTTLERTFMNNKAEQLIEQSRIFQETFTESFSNGYFDSQHIVKEMANLERYIGANVWIINLNREVLVTSGTKDYDLIESELDVGEIEKVFNGEIIKRQGYIRSFYEDAVLTVGYPIVYEDQVVMALFINVSIPEINRTLSEVYNISLTSLIIASMIASILIFFMSRTISREILDLNKAVKYIAAGNYNYQIETMRKDELGELANNFNEMAEELNRTEEIRRKFISDLSHDLRSPLTSITGYTRGILDGTIPEEKHEKYLNVVLSESERLRKLTNDILDLSKMQSGEMALNKVDFDIHELLINVVDRFEERIREKNVYMNFNLAEDAILVHADYEQITRVVHNLIDNAVKFVNEDGNIEITTQRKGDKMLVGIKNSGSVIPEEKLNEIWGRFSKLDISRGLKKDSSGLGLSIIKEIIHAHGEQVQVYSNELLGVVFIFSLSTQFINNKNTKVKISD